MTDSNSSAARMIVIPMWSIGYLQQYFGYIDLTSGVPFTNMN